MKQLETLLNSLIERGWKPAGFPGKSEIKISEDWDVVLYMDTDDATVVVKVKLRNLVSLESGLWQFVCDRSLLKSIWKSRAKEPSMSALGFKSEVLALSFEPEYRLLESALIPEEELGKFLIDNIKVEWNQISTPETK